MGPCNEKMLTGPALSVMKVLRSCEWIHTSFMLCLAAFPTESTSSIFTQKEGVREAPATTLTVLNIYMQQRGVNF